MLQQSWTLVPIPEIAGKVVVAYEVYQARIVTRIGLSFSGVRLWHQPPPRRTRLALQHDTEGGRIAIPPHSG